jgi:hypothetical protein
MLTLLDIAKRNAADGVVGLIDETYKVHPEVSGMTMFLGTPSTIPGVGDARTIKGQNYKTLVRTALPTVDFRNANEGVLATQATHENRQVDTYIMNPRWQADKAVADRSEDGPEAMIADEADAHFQAALKTLSSCFYYGNVATASQLVGSTKGFPGLLQSYSTTYEVDATGTSAGTGSSVWAVKFGRKAVQWVYGENGELELSDVALRDAEDAAGNKFTAYHQELMAYPGLQVSSTRAIGRIKDLTEDSGKTLNDDLISQLLVKFEVGWKPDVLFMTRRSVGQLQQSRTATNGTGAPAPFPIESHNVPIAVTDSLRDTEVLT